MITSPEDPVSSRKRLPKRSMVARRNEREDHVDRAGDDDVEENVGDLVSGCGKDLLRIVEDHVDAAPLLQNREHNAEQQALCHSG